MASKEIRVRMAEYHVARNPTLLVTLGLGSCVGVALYDSINRIGGLIHIMLPENNSQSNLAKYADTGIPQMITEMLKKGAKKRNMIAKIAGGARMFQIESDNASMKIGERNIEAVHKILKKEGIEIVAEDVGEDFGRTVKFSTVSGDVLVRSYKRGTITL